MVWYDTTNDVLKSYDGTNWNGAWAVTSVNNQTWAVVLDADDISDSTTTNKFVTASDKTTWSGKQDALVNQTNIKSINGNSLLGSGDLTVSWLPTGWTTGQILMMTANWPAWVTPADNGFIMLSSNSPETLKYLWVWTETQYGNISTYDENTRYDTHD
jgi:hypothetical protein